MWGEEATISWTETLNWIKRRQQAEPHNLSLCLLLFAHYDQRSPFLSPGLRTILSNREPEKPFLKSPLSGVSSQQEKQCIIGYARTQKRERLGYTRRTVGTTIARLNLKSRCLRGGGRREDSEGAWAAIGGSRSVSVAQGKTIQNPTINYPIW